jgi:hypothetical protein
MDFYYMTGRWAVSKLEKDYRLPTSQAPGTKDYYMTGRWTVSKLEKDYRLPTSQAPGTKDRIREVMIFMKKVSNKPERSAPSEVTL